MWLFWDGFFEEDTQTVTEKFVGIQLPLEWLFIRSL